MLRVSEITNQEVNMKKSDYQFATVKFETSDFTMDAGVDWEFDDDTANIEFFFDGYHLDETEEECLFDAIRSSFSNISDLFSSYDEEGEDTTYTRVELMLDTSECDETMVNDALMQFVPFLFSLWQGKLAIEDK